MRHIFAGALVAIGLIAAVPASAQTIGIGPGGVGVDLRTSRQRERDFERQEMRREMRRQERREIRRDMRRRDMYEDARPYRRY